MNFFLKKYAVVARSILGLAVTVFLVSSSFPVAAATTYVAKPGYTGKVMVHSAPSLTLRPGETVTYRVGVKNTGTVAWLNTGSRFVSVYTYFPKYRTSAFATSSWFKKEQPTKLSDSSVAPGQIGYFEFTLKAPAKIGTYEEGFWLAAENYTWIDGTQFKIPITVTNVIASGAKQSPTPTPSPAPTVKPTPTPGTPIASAGGALAATLMIRSFSDRVIAKGGDPLQVTVGFKNNGSVVWQTRVLRVRGTAIASEGTVSPFMHTSWPNEREPVRIREPISPGNIAYFTFTIAAPVQRGDYTLPLRLVVDEADVLGTELDIPFTVTEDAPQLPVQSVPIATGGTEPLIRVGLWKAPEMITISNSVAFDVRDENGAVLTTVPPENWISIAYDRSSRRATTQINGTIYSSANLMRFVPTNATGLFRVQNFGGWDATAYENRFRGTLELTYYKPNDNIWLIEELPLEEYMRGLAETSNSSHYEYQKALVIAARTYAWFVHDIGGKYALFDVTPTAADQVYRAYGSETVRPNVVRAVEETRGMVVTYQNEVVVTPYFSRSDGRTRSWQEVWCCKVKPWLVGVPAPHDVGLQLWGHGVGMSALDALGWARDGKTHDWILKYFYTGTELKRIY